MLNNQNKSRNIISTTLESYDCINVNTGQANEVFTNKNEKKTKVRKKETKISGKTL